MTARLLSVVPRPARTLVQDLRELVDAIDRRVPRLERDGERAIVRDASALKAEALKRIAELEAADVAAADAAADHVRP
jgi:hypothetical protein